MQTLYVLNVEKDTEILAIHSEKIVSTETEIITIASITRDMNLVTEPTLKIMVGFAIPLLRVLETLHYVTIVMHGIM